MKERGAMKSCRGRSKSVYLTALALFIWGIFILGKTCPAQTGGNPIWVESEGGAYQGEVETPKELRERARKEAQNRAIEKAVGVFIKSHTLVSNSQLTEDLIYASTRGKIEKVEVLQEGWDEKDRNLYRVKLKALILPVLPEKGEGLSLKASLSKSALKEEGTDNRSRALPEISGLLIRKPIMAEMVIRKKTAMLIIISRVR